MAKSEGIAYGVRVEQIDEHPLADANGILSKRVSFSVEPSGNDVPFDFALGAVQGETLSRCQLLREKGGVTVKYPESWMMTRGPDWQNEVVEMGLDHASGESA